MLAVHAQQKHICVHILIDAVTSSHVGHVFFEFVAFPLRVLACSPRKPMISFGRVDHWSRPANQTVLSFEQSWLISWIGVFGSARWLLVGGLVVGGCWLGA